MLKVNEGSSAWLSATFLDKVRSQVAPASIAYRIDCMTTKQPIRASTPIAASATVEIPLTTTDNAIKNPENREEIRRVTVSAQYGEGDAINSFYDYAVVNLTHV